MYVKRIRIENYGPVSNLDIEAPFVEDRPQPVVLVGENGSGKSIVLSHIVNGMIEAKHAAYPESRETDTNKVFKIRDPKYVATGSEYGFGRVDFERNQFIEELILQRYKRHYSDPPMNSGTAARSFWDSLDEGFGQHYRTSFAQAGADGQSVAVDVFGSNCLLYFPPNRFEDPSWLNVDNLRAKPRHTVPTRHLGQTDRTIISHSPLRELQHWLFSVAYDRVAFEARTTNVQVGSDGNPIVLPVWQGYKGDATKVYKTALELVRLVVNRSRPVTRLGIGGRHDRSLTIIADDKQVVPSVFQLSSGETALIALFLSIIRDFDLREDRTAPFASASDVRGLVVIDEVDLHLHVKYQDQILPRLIRMFPNVQFVMTTHSPVFVLGLARELGDEGFGLYELPSGSVISAEEFGEFGAAYRALQNTTTFRRDVRKQVEEAQRPILFVEGDTDCKYLQRASELLGRHETAQQFRLMAAGGDGELNKMWNARRALSTARESIEAVVLLHDPESKARQGEHGKVYRRIMPKHSEHPISKGIEHLFNRDTLQRACDYKPAFIDIEEAHQKTVRGETGQVPETWTVNSDEKTNLCNWLCEHGTAEDFRHLEPIFQMLEEVLTESGATSEGEG